MGPVGDRSGELPGERRAEAVWGGLAGKRILVTGASGFIGKHLGKLLSDAGIPYTALEHEHRETAFNRGATWVSADLGNREELSRLLRDLRPEIVFHLAGKLGSERTLEFAETALRENFTASHNLLVALGNERNALEQIVIAGTSEEYGNAEHLPVTEEEPPRPVSPYSASKFATTLFAQLYYKLIGLPVVIVRPFIVYGPGQQPSMMIPELICSVLENNDFSMTKGEQTRDFVYVEDVAACIAACAVAKEAAGEIINICSGEERKIFEIAATVMELMQAKTRLLAGARPYRQNEVWRLVGSNEKARRLLGWSPAVGLREGLARTIGWYRKEGRVLR